MPPRRPQKYIRLAYRREAKDRFPILGGVDGALQHLVLSLALPPQRVPLHHLHRPRQDNLQRVAVLAAFQHRVTRRQRLHLHRRCDLL